MRKYQVALSFAGEDVNYVDQIAEDLKSRNITFFYSNFEQAALWGKDLYQFLSTLYNEEAQYTIIFISESYANKLWTKLELQNAQARAFKESEEYILPIRIDDAKLPGIRDTIAYLDSRTIPVSKICDLIVQKIKPKFTFKHKVVTDELGEADKIWLLLIEIGEIVVAFNLDKYTDIDEILDDLYFNYLRDKVKPISYCSEWVLQAPDDRWGGTTLVVPCEWVPSHKKPERNKFRSWPTNFAFNEQIIAPGNQLKVLFEVQPKENIKLILSNRPRPAGNIHTPGFIKKLMMDSYDFNSVPDLPDDYMKYTTRMLVHGMFFGTDHQKYNILIDPKTDRDAWDY